VAFTQSRAPATAKSVDIVRAMVRQMAIKNRFAAKMTVGASSWHAVERNLRANAPHWLDHRKKKEPA
jgi:hypothetical protein